MASCHICDALYVHDEKEHVNTGNGKQDTDKVGFLFCSSPQPNFLVLRSIASEKWLTGQGVYMSLSRRCFEILYGAVCLKFSSADCCIQTTQRS